MSTSLTCLLTIFVVIGSYLVFRLNEHQKSKRKNIKHVPDLPLGFWGTFRNLRSKRTTMWDIFSALKQHGKLHRIYLPWPKFKAVVVNDLQLAKQLFNNPIFCGRPLNELWRYYTKGYYGIVTSFGSVWDEQRRYSLKKLRDVGFAHKKMESLIMLEVNDFISSLNQLKGQVISPNKMTSVPIINTIWVILTGQRFKDGNNEDSEMIHKAYEAFMRVSQMPQVMAIGTEISPFTAKLITTLVRWWPVKSMAGSTLNGFDNLRKFCVKFIQQRQKAVSQGLHLESYVDSYIQEINQTTHQQSSFYKEEGVNNLLATIADFILAGGDTCSNALAWVILHLIRNPDIQQKIQSDLDRVVGRERQPSLSDMPELPYITAFIMEQLRTTPVAITTLPHRTTEDVVVEGYFIEKNTIIVPNILAINTNPDIWGDPEKFRPERFLSSDGKTVIPNKAMISFGLGKRKCPGRQMAMNNLFLFVSSMCQKFNFKKDPNLQGIPPLVSTNSLLITPRTFYMVIEDREY